MQVVKWTGNSGREYDFELHPIGTAFNAVGACYIFTKGTLLTGWEAIYIGQTKDLSQRFDNHHAMLCIMENGATHIAVHTLDMGDPVARALVENDLLTNRNPPCNG